MSIVLRPAEPRDAAFLGWASVIAARSHLARGWFDVVLRREDAFLFEFAEYLALAEARSWWHWSIFRVAEVDGAAVSAMCGFGEVSYYEASGAAMAEASERIGLDSKEQNELWPAARSSCRRQRAKTKPGLSKTWRPNRIFVSAGLCRGSFKAN